MSFRIQKGLCILLVVCAFGVMDATAQVMRTMTANDPNVTSSWDWTVDQTYTLYLERDGVTYTTRLPWFRAEGPVPKHIGVNDVKPEDGWQLLFRDFGVQGDGTSVPRFALYNKYTGLVRVFFFNAKYPQPYTSAFAEVSLETYGSANNTLPAALTYYDDSSSEYLDAYDESTTVTAATELTYEEWGYFEFAATAFDPNVGQSAYEDATFHFDLTGVVRTELDISGSISLEALFTEGSNNLFNVIGNTLGGIQGDKAADVLRDFKSPEDHAEEKGSIRDELLDIAADGIETYLPGVGQFAGIIGNFLGGTSSSRLKGFNGEITLTGDATTAYGGVTEFFIRVPGTQRTANVGVPLIDEPIGIYNFATRPEMNVYEEETCYDDAYGQDEYCLTERTVTLAEAPDYVLNPDVTSDATVTVEMALTYIDGETKSEYMSPSELVSSGAEIRCKAPDVSYYCEDEGIAVRFIVDPNLPGFQPVYLYDVIRPDFTSVNYPSQLSKSAPDGSRVTHDVATGVEAFEIVSRGPNPFQDRTTVSFTLPEAGPVTAAVYDVMGRRVRTLVDATMRQGRHDLTVSGRGLPSGTYFYRIQSDDGTLTGKMTRVR